MSAIAGIFHMNGEPISTEHSNGMMKSLEKYPADDVQTWNNGNIFLGCHAQWITPESVGEKLPYYDHNRKLAITADAIIDNRGELFDKLDVEKYKRQQMTDSELILLSYEKWGEESPKHLIGDFAYMIWDVREQKLFGARDFSGSRTLYYYNDGKRFAFSTVIHPLFTLPYIQKAISEEWLAEYLAMPGIADCLDPRLTAYHKIEQLPPSHTITITSHHVRMNRYCYPLPNNPLHLKTDEEYLEAFRDVFQRAVADYTRTHHAVGVRLSGGLDSGSVASFAARSLKTENKTLQSYSYIPLKDFDDWTPKHRAADERLFIQSIVEYVGNIDEHYLPFEGKSAYTEIDDLLDVLEMPYKFFENSYWIKGIYEKAKQDGIGVLLSGSRGNYTISWGPALDYYAILLKKLKWVHLYREARLYSINKGSGRKRVLEIVGKKAYPGLNQFFPGPEYGEFPAFIHPDFAKKTRVFEKIKENSGSSVFSMYEARNQQFSDVASWHLNGTIRTKFSLNTRLWDRDPTNDLRVVQFCLSVPDDQYIKNGFDRALIRRATENYLPDKVRLNTRIRGIQGADGVYRMKEHWSNFIEEAEQLCDDTHLSGILDVHTIKDALRKIGQEPKSEYIYYDEMKILMRALIVGRFVKKVI